ncbi:MAG: 30S ribosomal protein S20, partial [Thermodesulfobacteriota bacterium]
RARQSEQKRLRNKIVKTRVKNVVKSIRTAVQETPDPEAILKELNFAKSVIAKSSKRNAIHKKTASRKISRLTKLVNASRKS